MMAVRFANERTAADEKRIDAILDKVDERRFVAIAYIDSRRVFRLIEGGRYVEAHQIASGWHVAAKRRARQLGFDPEGSAA
jgi:hypothetical protein